MKAFPLIIVVLCSLTAGCQSQVEPQNSDSEPAREPYTMVVLGDSYSTFSGAIPEGYPTWYPSSDNDVEEEAQTWWSLLSNRLGYVLLYNSSYSGSTICNTGYYGVNSSSSSFVTRMKRDIITEKGYAGRCKEIPDLVLILGGTNDYWAGSPWGERIQRSEWEKSDLSKCLPATCYMCGYLRENLPHTRIVLIMNTELGQEFYDEFPKIAKEYDVEYLKLESIDKQAGHPSKAGMISISNQI